jgi:peptidoglycan/LPS O-acetylase OafA/YrhL
MFFFVLSGFVLSRRFLESESFVYLGRSVAKRYFRLAGPALLSCLISALFFVSGSYRFKEVAEITHSSWLAEFGYAIPENLNFRPSLWNATKNGLFDLFFIPHHNYYNSPLWTMFFELMGSYIVFLSAALMVLARRLSVVLSWGIWLAGTAFAAGVSVYYAAFLTGLGFAMFMMKRSISVPCWATCILLALAVLLLGFTGPTHEYAFMTRFGVSADDAPAFATIGAVLLMIAVETSSPLKMWLCGPIGIFLGKLSFPVYLVHFLVLASIGCEVWLRTIDMGPWVALLSAFSVTVVASIVAALPLAMFDRWWTSLVNRAAISVIPREAAR